MEEEKIAQGTYDFRVMREKGYRYVDKTALLYPLVTRDGDGFFFISRPRRFGKSLMLSTLECLFRGERELFKGLAIDKMDYDWKSYPILHFNFAGLNVPAPTSAGPSKPWRLPRNRSPWLFSSMSTTHPLVMR